VEISIDDGPWQVAELDPNNSRYSWKLFSLDWDNATPGAHTLVSRVADVESNTQPPASALPEKASYREELGQFPRTVRIG